jgi:ABC-type amino acid transport substrate-binding protein
MIYARAGDARFSKPVGPEDLNRSSLTFGGIEGDSTALYAKLLFPKAKVSELPQLSDTAQIFMEIDASKLDLAIVEPGVAARAQAGNPGHFKAVNFTGHLPAYGAAFALPKGEERLVSTINQTVDYLNVNGIIDDVLNKYDPQKALFIRPAKPYAE